MEGRWDRSSEGRKKRRKKGKRGRVKNSRPFERSNGVKTGKLVQLLWSTVWRFLKKLEIGLPYGSAIPLLDIHTKETRIEGVMCTPMFITALFTIART